MNLNEYQELAARTINPDLSVPERIMHGTFGLNSEAGEVAGILQKEYQGHPINRDDLVKELGDCLWMLAEIAGAINVPLEEIAQRNIDKLRKRYPDGFSAERSINREEYKRGC